MEIGQKYTASEGVMIRKVKDGAVLLDMDGGVYYGLDPIGVQIWELICEQRSLISIRKLLLQEYDVSRGKLDTDIRKLMTELLQHGLVRISD